MGGEEEKADFSKHRGMKKLPLKTVPVSKNVKRGEEEKIMYDLSSKFMYFYTSYVVLSQDEQNNLHKKRILMFSASRMV